MRNMYLREIGWKHCIEGKTILAFYNLSRIKKTESNRAEYEIGYRAAREDQRNRRIKRECNKICKKMMGEKK